ncbi:pseudouridine synthase [Dacryopinax primogenitus]|uniref:Pseudouridine synthase n=1 Tax=Dacryopinax primogenitus (strain DJM 731) TaxID=1858805 RepID=M5G6T2_DACPD|nr:pseudouridine synthase [Dacryopinax primogenitus]EJU04414.1 pseudouridine synthase [Dacryopinax primogenitus]
MAQANLAKYDTWSRLQLIARLNELDIQKEKAENEKDLTAKARELPRPYVVSSRPKRKIALKFCYHGWEYCGLEKQKGYTPIPTVESVLESALIATRLIDPVEGFEGAGYGKSGRTDRGVSAAGQVVSLWVRSMVAGGANDGERKEAEEVNLALDDEEVDDSFEPLTESMELVSQLLAEQDTPEVLVDDTQHLLPTEGEIPYARVLNRVLPPSIRVLAWSPVHSDFEARFSCIGRHYKYFFRLHPGLDLSRMRDAAARMKGTHDWRNFCRLDGSKGDVRYVRTIEDVTLEPVAKDEDPTLYVLNVQGHGFLWHQIRHIAAVLFLVGQGLEHPSVVTSMLNTDQSNPLPPFREDEPLPEIVEGKPNYEMADALPLVLWDCRYSDEDLNWIPDEPGYSQGFVQSLETTYTQSLMQSTILSYFTRAAELRPPPVSASAGEFGRRDCVLLDMGAGRFKVNIKYKPLLKRERGSTPDEVLRRWREGKGGRRAEKRAARAEQDEMRETGDGDE